MAAQPLDLEFESAQRALAQLRRKRDALSELLSLRQAELENLKAESYRIAVQINGIDMNICNLRRRFPDVPTEANIKSALSDLELAYFDESDDGDDSENDDPCELP